MAFYFHIIFNIWRSPCYDNENKTERKLVAYGDYCSIVNAEQKFPRYFEGYLGFFAIFQSIYFFIPLFIAEPWLGNAGLRQVSF